MFWRAGIVSLPWAAVSALTLRGENYRHAGERSGGYCQEPNQTRMDHVTAEIENYFIIHISEKDIMYDDACKLCKYYDAVYKIRKL